VTPNLDSTGNINGTVEDAEGAPITGAHVKLVREDQSLNLEVLSGDDGEFSFSNIASGPFKLTITATGFAPQSSSGTLHAGEFFIVPKIAMPVATALTEVKVTASPVEVAQEQIKEEEKQRVLGVFPNFYVTYVPDAAPLNARQKFELARKSVLDPVSIALVGVQAGVEQARNYFPGYGQGAAGYGKRFGAAYGDLLSGTLIGGMILPTVFKQDPRYFFKGTGSKRSRLAYALSRSVIAKGDNGKWEPNYSNILGSFAAGAISNLYYPAESRHGAKLTVENGLIGIGAVGAGNVLQEFLIPKLSHKIPKRDPNKQ